MYYNSAADSALGMLLGFIGTIWLLVLAFFVVNIIANWKIFTKAGQPGWAAIVPFYKQYIEFKIYWGNGLLFLVPLVLSLLGFIPLLGDASCHRKHRHQCCDAVQESRFIRSGRWLHHWPGPAGPHLQYDSGLRPVSVPRRSAGRLFLRPAEN